MKHFNLQRGETEGEPDADTPVGYRRSAVAIGPKIGATRLGMSVYDLPPGEAICPYHFEWTDEEWLVVILGSPTLRTPEGEAVIAPGDVVCFPAGPDGAHKAWNAGEHPVRVGILSTKSAVGVAEYPDSDKLGVFWADGSSHVLRRAPQLDYWDGERRG